MVITIVQTRNRFFRFSDDKTSVLHNEIRYTTKFSPINWGYSRDLKGKGSLWWKDLYFLSKEGMLGYDGEGTVDGAHPNDIGMVYMAEVYGKAVKEALKLQ